MICSDCYTELIKQIIKRLDLNDPVLTTASSVDPKKLHTLKEFNSTIEQYTNFLESGKEQAIKNEFHELRTAIICKDIMVDDLETCWR